MHTSRLDTKIVLFMFLFLGISEITWAERLSVEYYCDLGKKFYEEGRFRKSIEEFSKAFLIDPSCETARVYLAKAGMGLPRDIPPDIVSKYALQFYSQGKKSEDENFFYQQSTRGSFSRVQPTAVDSTYQLQKERDFLKKKISNQERQLKILESKLHPANERSQQTQNLTSTQSIQKIQYALLKNKADLNKAQHRIDNYENLLEQKEKELRSRDSALSMMKQQAVRQKFPVRKVTVDQDQIKQLMKKYNGETVALKEKLNQTNGLYQKEIAVYQQKIKLLEKQLMAYQRENIKVAGNKKAEEKTDKKQPIASKVKLNKSIAALKQEIGKFKKKLEDQKKEIKVRTDVIQEQNKELVSLENELKKEQGPSQGKDKIIADLKRQLSQQEQLNELSEQSIKQRDLKIKQLSDELNQLKQKIES